MTEKLRNGIINNSTSISVGLVVVLLGTVYVYATEIQSLHSSTENNSAQIQSVDDKVVPRSELENRLQRLEDNQQEILKRLRKM